MLLKKKKLYYKALLEKNTDYDGIFYVGVKTTGIFCRSICPAKKPKFENCEFFNSAKEALISSFRPCHRCKPLSHPNQMPPFVQRLIKAVEECPERRWKDRDFDELGVNSSTIRRQFKKRFNMTFVEYARSRRIGLAMKEIRKGESVIDAQLSVGYESSSGFRDAFSQILGCAPTKYTGNILKASWLDTKLGPMIAIADESALYLLEFVDRRGLEREIERLRKRLKVAILPGETSIIASIKSELNDYFDGKLLKFKTPVYMLGSDFQKHVWQVLMKIPSGGTWSYSDVARAIGKPMAFRAVANANGMNQLAIIIPCHRVIRANEDLGGYGGGIARKEWMLSHEKNINNKTHD